MIAPATAGERRGANMIGIGDGDNSTIVSGAALAGISP
jgi:hypothetical protein